MKPPKTNKPDDAPAAGAEQSPTDEPRDGSTEPEADDPKANLAELQAIFAKRAEKLKRLGDLEDLKAKYTEEIDALKIDPLAEDAEAKMSFRKSREAMIEMIDTDIWRIKDAPDEDEARAKFLVNDLAQRVRKACDRDNSLLIADIRAFVKSNPAASFLFDDQELHDDQIRALPCCFIGQRLAAEADIFNLRWRDWDNARLAQEAPKFLELAARAASGERILFLPAA